MEEPCKKPVPSDGSLRFRFAQGPGDLEKLVSFYREIFPDEPVDALAESLFHHFPGMEKRYWFLAEDESEELVAALALIPWCWKMDGVFLKVAEMGLVGTREEYRKRGIMKELNRRFDETFRKENFDLAVIQGIPGFYHHFGYHYAVELNNHVNMPPHLIADVPDPSRYSIRAATVSDMEFFCRQDDKLDNAYSLRAHRSEKVWRFLLGQGGKSRFASRFLIIENGSDGEKYYCRLPSHGFGNGLIVSEVSENIAFDAYAFLMSYLKGKALEEDKPYIRLNLHTGSRPAQMAIRMGAGVGLTYAWQIKIPDPVRFMEKIAPVLEKRLAQGAFADFSQTFRLELFQQQLDLKWKNGHLESVLAGQQSQCPITFCVPPDLFASLVLGHRSWRELQYVRPDIFPFMAHVGGQTDTTQDCTAVLADTLFSAQKGWIYEQY